MTLLKKTHPLATAVFDDLSEYECLSSTRIHERHLPHLSYRRCQQLLQEWVADHYLYAAQLTVQSEATGTSSKRVPLRLPRIYFLREAAADLLAATIGHRPHRFLRSDPAPLTLFHRYQNAETRLRYDASSDEAGLPASRWLIESDVRDDLPSQTPPNQRSSLYHSFKLADRTISVRPDAASWHDIPQACGESLSILGLWEIDRSSEGLKQLQRTKPRGYQLLLERQEFQRYWQQIPDCVRVFWVVPSKQRMRTILKALAEFPLVLEVSRFLRFADGDTKNLLADLVWYHPLEAKYVPIVEL